MLNNKLQKFALMTLLSTAFVEPGFVAEKMDKGHKESAPKNFIITGVPEVPNLDDENKLKGFVKLSADSKEYYEFSKYKLSRVAIYSWDNNDAKILVYYDFPGAPSGPDITKEDTIVLQKHIPYRIEKCRMEGGQQDNHGLSYGKPVIVLKTDDPKAVKISCHK